ncbi:MAG: DUF3108 domain-containing protein [Bacteroidaceae bacterium]|nr:DUF3108 domain-containing protein [Bacteroidaceae bacterium]
MKRAITIILIFAICSVLAKAQCSMQNTAFQSGEYLTYNLYYNWKFIWIKAGTATMSVQNANYKGKQAYKSSLITKGNSKADKFFVMRDTLLCYTSQDLLPLYFRKGAKEGKRYTVDEVWYNYANGKISLTQHYLNKNGELHKKSNTSTECIVDMMSAVLRARNMNNDGWQKGHQVPMRMADGDDISQTKLVYRGKTTVKADDDIKYDCLELSFMEQDGKKWKEIIRFFVTDDDRHIPIRLDLNLKFGSAKAFLTSMKGVKQ